MRGQRGVGVGFATRTRSATTARPHVVEQLFDPGRASLLLRRELLTRSASGPGGGISNRAERWRRGRRAWDALPVTGGASRKTRRRSWPGPGRLLESARTFAPARG